MPILPQELTVPFERLKAFIAERAKQDKNDPWLADAQKAFDTIAKAEKTRAELIKDITVLENAGGFNSSSFSIARTLFRASEELSKPGGERLPRRHVDIRDHDLRALGDEQLDRGSPDAVRATGDDGDLALQCVTHAHRSRAVNSRCSSDRPRSM